MRRSILHVSIALLVLGVLLGTSRNLDITQADLLFEKSLFQEAVEVYETVYEETADIETREKALLRSCECLVYLYRYGEAAEKVLSGDVPERMPYRAHFLLLKADILSRLPGLYWPVMPEEVIEEEDKEVFRLTPEEIRPMIGECYAALWELREALLRMDVTGEPTFIDTEKADVARYPTLFDYLILVWTRFILSHEMMPAVYTLAEALAKAEAAPPRPKAELLLVDVFDRSVDLSDPPGLLAAELMEEASRQGGVGRQEGRERWKIERLLLPVRHAYRFDLRGVSGDPGKLDLDQPAYKHEALSILLRWMDGFETRVARAEAGWEAAQILHAERRFAETIDLCRRIERDFEGTRAALQARVLRARIEMPRLELKARMVMPPGRDALRVKTKNLKQVHFQLYGIDPYRLTELYRAYLKESSSRRYRWRLWSDLFGRSWLGSDHGQAWFERYVSKTAPYASWITEIGGEHVYESTETEIECPALDVGIYLVVASGEEAFEIGRSLISACFLNVTDLMLLGTSGFTTKTLDAYHRAIEGEGPNEIKDEGFRFYTLDAKTGEPVSDASIKVNRRGPGTHNIDYSDLVTDGEGVASVPLPARVFPRKSSPMWIEGLAQGGSSYAYWESQQFITNILPETLRMFMQTDRPIYQPGDKVKAKALVVRKTAQGFRSLVGKRKVMFKCTDPNGKNLFEESVELNDFGSASTEFEIPHGRLLGRYTLSAGCSDGSFDANARVGFSVEEYKRPEFEIVLRAADVPWKYNIPVEIKGRAAYYFGGPVPRATIKYHVRHEVYVPYFYRYWFEDYGRDTGRDAASGEVTTDENGEFVIAFTPTPRTHPYAAYVPDVTRYVVEVEGHDAGGRTIEAERSYRASNSPIYIVIDPRKGFFLEREQIEIESRRLTLDDMPAAGASTYQVFRLPSVPPESLPDYERWKNSASRGWAPPLDVQLKDVPDGELAAEGSIDHDADGKGDIVIERLSQGTYRIVQESRDDWGGAVVQRKVFVVARDTETAVPVMAYAVTLSERDEYEVGETARFILGSGEGSGIYHVEIWAGWHLAGRYLARGEGPVRFIEIPITDKMKGGFTLLWFGIKGFAVHVGREAVPVPWKEKRLNVTLSPFDREMEPGREYRWGINLTDWRGRPVKGEVLALMYDRSLEYYVRGHYRWLDRLYLQQSARIGWRSSAFNPRVHAFSITDGPIYDLLQDSRNVPPKLGAPGLRTAKAWRAPAYDAAHYYLGSETIAMEITTSAMAGLTLEEEDIHIRGGRAEETTVAVDEMGLAAPAERPPPVEAREKFFDTAFFIPHIVTSSGTGRALFEFTAPEQVTGWKVMVFAATQDVSHGSLTEETVTRKDLMVRADIPRFFREKDQGTVTAIVHNESEATLEGDVFIEVLENDENINHELGLTGARKHFSLEPHGVQAFDWAVEIPPRVTTYRVRVVAVADNLSDAEERELPVLPSRQRLTETAFIALSGSETGRLKIDLRDDPTRIDESMLIQIDPQLALSILSALPFLCEYPHGCVEQIVNRFVPLSIVNRIYSEYPALGDAVSKVPERTTVTSPWQKDDPLRLITLMETPWIWQSEGRGVSGRLVNLLNPEAVENQKRKHLERLLSAQLENGAFPWWPGGEANPYMTLYVLAGFAEARRYGVEVPETVVEKALRYVSAEIPKWMKPDERRLALVSYAAYVVTSYDPEEFREARKLHEAAEFWVDFLEKYIHALPPLAKAYLAYTNYHLGNVDRAQELLDIVMDGAREDTLTGVYWTPEKYSWVWYSDRVEKHAFLLRALQKLRPDDRRIPGMVRWLLFNRKGSVWKSTKASAAAVYALLEHLGEKGALVESEAFTVGWGENTYSAIVEPYDWLDDPLTWRKTGFEIHPEMHTATVEKAGPGIAFANLTWTYSTDELPEQSRGGILELERRFYRRIEESDQYHLVPIESGAEVRVGDQIEVQLKVNTRSQFEYMHLKDPKAAAFEAEQLLSVWKHDNLAYYEEPRHSLTNFFIEWLPHGEFLLSYRLRPTKPGLYRIGAATLQSMYAPEMTAHSSGFLIRVVK